MQCRYRCLAPETDTPALPAAVDLKARFGAGVIGEAIADEVLEQPADLDLIDRQFRQRLAGNPGRWESHGQLEVFQDLGNDRIDIGHDKRSAVGGYPRQREQSRYLLLHPPARVLAALDKVPALFIEPVAVAASQQLHESGDGPQRFLEIVRDHRGEFLQLPVREFKGLPGLFQFPDKLLVGLKEEMAADEPRALNQERSP